METKDFCISLRSNQKKKNPSFHWVFSLSNFLQLVFNNNTIFSYCPTSQIFALFSPWWFQNYKGLWSSVLSPFFFIPNTFSLSDSPHHPFVSYGMLILLQIYFHLSPFSWSFTNWNSSWVLTQVSVYYNICVSPRTFILYLWLQWPIIHNIWRWNTRHFSFLFGLQTSTPFYVTLSN